MNREAEIQSKIGITFGSTVGKTCDVLFVPCTVQERERRAIRGRL